MKLNTYLNKFIGIKRSEFKRLSERTQKSIRREHQLSNQWTQKCRSSRDLIVNELKHQGWVENTDEDVIVKGNRVIDKLSHF